MAKFEVYDRVTLNKDLDFYELLEGEEGVIMGINKDNFYAVQFPFEDDVLHECEGLVPSGRGLLLEESDLKKYW